MSDWAVLHNYTLWGTGAACGDDYPVHSLHWYDALKWCNAKSEMEGLTPVYTFNGATFRSGTPAASSEVSQNLSANGYRLPLEAEWEFAAQGGNMRNRYSVYSGSNNLNTVGWNNDNSKGGICDLESGRGTQPVAMKSANELGLYDMSGNVSEWCWEVFDSHGQRQRGGSWRDNALVCSVSYRSNALPNFKQNTQGIRIVRSTPNKGAENRIISLSGDLIFGVVNVGESKSAILNITNTGVSELTVTEIAFPDDFSGDWTSGTIAPGGTQAVNVTFKPLSGGFNVNAIRVSSNADSGGSRYPVVATGYVDNEAAVSMVLVEGGTLPQGSAFAGTVIDSFEIGKTEVTWGEWQTIREWAVDQGYDLADRGDGCADDHPVHSMNWFDVIKWCNAKSEKEGLTPVYTVSDATYKTGQPLHTSITLDTSANGYRLPLVTEWDFAALGGNQTHGYNYAGSNDLDAVGWYKANSWGGACGDSDRLGSFGKSTWPVAQKTANELGLYDMSGNVWELCWDVAGNTKYLRGGVWSERADACSVLTPYNLGASPSLRWEYQGFRLARSPES